MRIPKYIKKRMEREMIWQKKNNFIIGGIKNEG